MTADELLEAIRQGKRLMSENGRVFEFIAPLAAGGWAYHRLRVYDEYDQTTEAELTFGPSEFEALAGAVKYPADMAEY